MEVLMAVMEDVHADGTIGEGKVVFGRNLIYIAWHSFHSTA